MKPVFIPSNMSGRKPVSLTNAGNTASVNKQHASCCQLLWLQSCITWYILFALPLLTQQIFYQY